MQPVVAPKSSGRGRHLVKNLRLRRKRLTRIDPRSMISRSRSTTISENRNVKSQFIDRIFSRHELELNRISICVILEIAVIRKGIDWWHSSWYYTTTPTELHRSLPNG